MNDLFEAGMIVVNPDKSITVSKDGQLIGNASDQEMWCCSALEAHRMYELLCISNLVVYFFAKKDVLSLIFLCSVYLSKYYVNMAAVWS